MHYTFKNVATVGGKNNFYSYSVHPIVLNRDGPNPPTPRLVCSITPEQGKSSALNSELH